MDANLFSGVLPAITTPLAADGGVDHSLLARHAAFLLQNGCRGIIALGSLGEGATLSTAEKLAILQTLVRSSGAAPVIAGIAALATRDAVELAKGAAGAGCRGLMVLPAYVHRGSEREALVHVAAVMDAVALPCMLYNNPSAYGTDFTPPLIEQLAGRHDRLVAVKESTGDARRVTAIRARCGDRLGVLVGMDDMVVEGVDAGAVGWVAGLVNALPRESVALFDLARQGAAGRAAAAELYRWFLPLLRLDTVPEFVQWIKLVQHEVGWGEERVRPPRLRLEGPMREAGLALIRGALAARPKVLPAVPS